MGAIDKKSFKVTVRGQYQALGAQTGVPAIKFYEETFILPTQEAALSNICKHLLSPRLKKTHADFIRFRTHELVGIDLVGYTPNKAVLNDSIDDMNLLDLHDFCILNQIMIDPYKHASKDIFAIRAMVQKAYSEKRQAKKDQAESAQGAATKEADALRKANDLPPTATDPVININEKKLSNEAAAVAVSAAPTADQQIGPEADEPLPAEEPEPTLE